MLKNKFWTIIFVQTSAQISFISSFSHHNIFSKCQDSESLVFEIICIFETDEIEAIASPLKPKVITLYKSSKFFIFEVEYFSAITSKSLFSIPVQLSVIIISSIHPLTISTFMLFAFASIEFSTNSFTTEKGFSTTSQAAIWFAKFLSSFIIVILKIFL